MRTLSHGRPTRKRVNDRWLTPLPLIRALGRFDLDPCGAPGHPTAEEVWTPEGIGDGLALPWEGRIWLNPPYGRHAEPWLEKMSSHRRGIALIFARTDTESFHRWVFPFAHTMLFMKGRIRFLDASGVESRDAGAPSVLVAYGDSDAAALAGSSIPGFLSAGGAR